LSNRNAGFASQQHAKNITDHVRTIEAVDFFNLLTAPELLEMSESLLPEHRERLYPPTLALSMFMGQVLNEDGSCQKAVDSWAAQRAAEGLAVQSVNTGAYCKARQRLPLEMVRTLARHTGTLLNERAQEGWRWRGRCVKLVDGTGILMPDTAANQACYPQPSSQAPGVGSPLARLELKLVMPEIIKRLPDLELNGPVERSRSNWVHGYTSIPVKFTPSAKLGA